MRERSSVADSSCSGRSLMLNVRALTPQRVPAGKARKSFVCLICKFATARPRGHTNSRDCKSPAARLSFILAACTHRIQMDSASEAGAIAALSALNSAALLQGPSRPAGEGGDVPKLSSELAVSNQPSMNVAETTVAETNQMNVVAANQLAAGLQQSHIYGLLLASQCAPKEMGMLKRPRPDQPPAKQGWTKKEDETILRTVREVGTKWSRIARELPGRSDDAVRNRYIRIQRKPSVSTNNPSAEGDEGGEGKVETVTSKRGDMWTASEDEAVLRGVNEHGLKWQVISGMLAGRSINAVRNRYLRLAPQQQQQQQQQWQLQQLQQQLQQQQLGQLQQQQFQQQQLQQQQLLSGANLTGGMGVMPLYPQLVTQLAQNSAPLGGAAAAQPYYLNASRPLQSVQATCSMRLPEATAAPRHLADQPLPPLQATGPGAAAAPPPPAAHEPSPEDYLRPRPARPAEPAQPLPQAAPAMRPPAFADLGALGGMSHWFSPPAFAKPAPAAPAPLPAAAPTEQARSYSLPHANVFTVPPVPTQRRAAAQPTKPDSATQLPGDLAPRIDVSNLAALSAVPDAALSARFDAALSARFAAAVQNNERPSAPRAAPAPAPPPPSPHAARPQLPGYGGSLFAAPPGSCGTTAPAAAQQPAANVGLSPTCLIDSLSVEEFVNLRTSRERELASSRELVDLTSAPPSLETTLLEDAGRLNLSNFNGLAGLLDAL